MLSQVPRRKRLCERTPPQVCGQVKALVFVRSPLGQPSQLTQHNTQHMLRAKTSKSQDSSIHSKHLPADKNPMDSSHVWM